MKRALLLIYALPAVFAIFIFGYGAALLLADSQPTTEQRLAALERELASERKISRIHRDYLDNRWRAEHEKACSALVLVSHLLKQQGTIDRKATVQDCPPLDTLRPWGSQDVLPKRSY